MNGMLCRGSSRNKSCEGERINITAVKIGLIGDYSPEVAAHVAIPKALALAGNETESVVEATWLATETVAQNIDQLSSFDMLWCVPASPMKGSVAAITI